MILVDTSVWIEHLRRGNARLRDLLEAGEVLAHPLVLGELACERLRNREEVLSLLGELPQAAVAGDVEVLHLIEQHHLYGIGIGWIDVSLLAAALLSGCRLWTLDKSLAQVAWRLGVAADL